MFDPAAREIAVDPVSPAPPEVSVIVPVRNEARVIRETAASIIGQRLGGSMEVLFVEGRSTDGTRAVLDELAAADPRIRVLDNPAGDLGSALGIGLRAASGTYVAKMDAHTEFPRDYLAVGVDRLRRGDVNWVSGPPIPRGQDAGSRRVALALGSRLGVGGARKWPRSFAADGPAEQELDTGVFSGVWRRSALERLGGWDPEWPANEDAELASRFLAAGERIVCVHAMGAHYLPRSTLRGLARQYYRYGYFRIKTARRHPHSLRRSHVLPPAVVVTLLASAGRGPVGSAARAGAAVYGAAVAVASWSAAGTEHRRDLPWLPLVFGTMHVSYGVGLLVGCARFGVPLRALWRLVRP